MAALQRWVSRWGVAAITGLLAVALVGSLWTRAWVLAAVCAVLLVTVSRIEQSRIQRTPLTSEVPAALAAGAEVQCWVGAASLPGRTRIRRLNMRVNVGKSGGELTLVGDRLSLVIRGRTLDTAMGIPLVNLTPADGVVFPARPVLVGRGLGIQPAGGEAYYFFPQQRNREQILLALQAVGFRVEARERRPSSL